MAITYTWLITSIECSTPDADADCDAACDDAGRFCRAAIYIILIQYINEDYDKVNV